MSTGRITLNLALSVDGFIATEDGGVSWLEAVDDASDDPDALDGFQAFFDDVDCLVMGSRTYEKILDHAEWPYGQKPTYVTTGRELSPVTDAVELYDGNVTDLVRDIERRYRHLWLVGGGQLARTFLRQDLLDELWLTVVPVVLGSGIPLFDDSLERRDLTLQEAIPYASGAVELRYAVDAN